VNTRAGKVLAIATALLSSAVTAQTFRSELFHGRQAYVLDNGVVRASLLRGGGHIAELRFLSNDPHKSVNPLRIPHYPTIEPYDYDPAKHDSVYGTGPHRWLSSGYMGHLLCFPAFGPPSSPSEVAAGLGNHGEAPIVEWKPMGELRRGSFRYAADLPKTQFRVERTVTLPAGESVMYVEESAENLAPYDRPINWVQHATFGPPFTTPGRNFLDLSGGKGRVAGGAVATSSLKPESDVQWPLGVGPDGKEINLRVFQPKARAGTYFAVLMDQSRRVNFFTVYNSEFRVLIGYLFSTSDSPWLGDFQENRRIEGKPWNGKAVTRGIEFGTTPFAEGLRKSVERGAMFGVPAFRWIGGRQRLTTVYAIFLVEIPANFGGVRDVVAVDGAITVLENGGERRQIKIAATRLSLLSAVQ